jgi:hypothetical protein
MDAAVAANRGSIRGIARQHRVSPDALERHAAKHLPRALARAVETREDARAEDLAAKTRRLEADARRLLKKAEDEGDYRCAIGAVKTLLDVVALLHKVAEERKAEAADFLKTQAWVTVREAIVECLTPFPGALEALACAMERLEDNGRRLDTGLDLARPDTAALGLRAANLLANLVVRHPEALEDDTPASPAA